MGRTDQRGGWYLLVCDLVFRTRCVEVNAYTFVACDLPGIVSVSGGFEVEADEYHDDDTGIHGGTADEGVPEPAGELVFMGYVDAAGKMPPPAVIRCFKAPRFYGLTNHMVEMSSILNGQDYLR